MTSTGEVLVFVVSRAFNPSHRRVLWRVSRADAMKICGDSRTSSHRYMLCWTETYLDDQEVNRYIPDTGMHADVLREHGVTVLDSYEIRTTEPAAAA